MTLGSDNEVNVKQLMEWLRSEDASSAAINLREELAYLLFYGDPTWATNEDDSSVSDYLGILSGWLADDSGDESTFLQLTTPGDDADTNREIFTTWFTTVVAKWKQVAKTTESGDKGIINPNYASDQTPGTQYYWYDPDNEVYLYAPTADAPDSEWLSYEDRRYTPVAYDDARSTNYRQDLVTGEHEFQSRVTAGKWLTVAEWEEEVLAAADEGNLDFDDEESLYTAPVYDAGFEMYRRFNSATRAYEYADDTTSENWLTLEQATALRTAGVLEQEEEAAAQVEAPGEATPQEATAQAAYQEIILPSLEQIENSGDPAIESLLQQPDGRARLHEEVMKIAAELLATTSAEG